MAKPYGKTFVNSLPDMLPTASLDDAVNFLQLRELENEAVSH